MGSGQRCAWRVCDVCFCPCNSLQLANLLGRSRYQTSEFLNTSEFPTDSPTRNAESPSAGGTSGIGAALCTALVKGQLLTESVHNLTESVHNVVLQKSFSLQIRQLITDITDKLTDLCWD